MQVTNKRGHCGAPKQHCEQLARGKVIHARCIPTELLLERQTPSRSPAESLRIEAHLTGCQRCSNEHNAMLALLKLIEERAQSAESPSVHARAITRALSRWRPASLHARKPQSAGESFVAPAALLRLGLAFATLIAVLAMGH